MHLPAGLLSKSYQEDMAIIRTKSQWFLLIGTLALIFSLPLFPHWAWWDRVLSFLILTGIMVIAVLGLNILTGYCGQISLGQAAFMAVGAYTCGILASRFDMPFWVAIPSGALAAGVTGLFFGLPSLRVKGLYIILATIAAQFIVNFLILQFQDYTGGAMGLDVPAIKLGPFLLNTDRSIYTFVLGVTVLIIFLAKNLIRTRVGRAFIAIRDNDLAAEIMGVNLYFYKLTAFFLGCAFAGLAGGLLAYYIRLLTQYWFTLEYAVIYLGMLIVGGMGSITGAIMGVIFWRLITLLVIEVFPLTGFLPAPVAGSLRLVIPGLVLILFLIFEPRGLYHRWEIIKSYYRLWPYAY